MTSACVMLQQGLPSDLTAIANTGRAVMCLYSQKKEKEPNRNDVLSLQSFSNEIRTSNTDL